MTEYLCAMDPRGSKLASMEAEKEQRVDGVSRNLKRGLCISVG